MEINANNIMLVVATLLLISVFVGKAGSRYGMPALLLFLGVGMLAGTDGFGLQFDSAQAAQFIGMISLSIILFSGGLDTKYRDIKPILGPGLILATVGVLLTTLITGTFIYYVFHWLAPAYAFGWIESMLLASIMSSTDSASVFSILNSSKTGLRQNLKPTLELESGSNDPMAYMLVIMFIGIIESGAASIDSDLIAGSAILLCRQLAIGAVGGFIIGYVSVKIINRLRSDNEFLYPVTMLACAFFAFTLTELAGGNAYLAVYLAGLVVGNNRIDLKRTITTFFGGFTWLVQIIMFLSLGLLVNPRELLPVAIPAIALGLFMILVARPLAVFASLAPFRKFTFKARCYISWVGLRGAVPIIFATYAIMSPAVEHARFMFNVVFFITILSLIIQGTTVNKMASILKLKDTLRENAFDGVNLPDHVAAALTETDVNASMLSNGNTLKEIELPPNTLVVMVKHGDEYIVPKGNTHLYLGDTLLLITEKGSAPSNTGA